MKRVFEARAVALRRFKTFLATAVLMALLPVLLSAWCDSRIAAAARALTRVPTASPGPATTRPPVSEGALLFRTAAERNASLTRGEAWADGPVPEWLLGRPRCEEAGTHCAFERAVWEELEGLHEAPLACPASPRAVVGCDLAWQTGLGHHMHVLGHCLTRALMLGVPVVLLGTEWSYGRGCAPDHLFQCFFTAFAGPCEEVIGMPWVGNGGLLVIVCSFSSSLPEARPCRGGGAADAGRGDSGRLCVVGSGGGLGLLGESAAGGAVPASRPAAGPQGRRAALWGGAARGRLWRGAGRVGRRHEPPPPLRRYSRAPRRQGETVCLLLFLLC